MLPARSQTRYQNPARSERPLDEIVFSTATTVAARFRCERHDPRFRRTGPTSHYLVTFPRTAVWIRYADSKSIVADPTVSTIYNSGQEYTRRELCADGDRCEWLAVSRETAFSIAETFDPGSRERDSPFRRHVAPIESALYLSQRSFFAQLKRGELAPLEAEERIIGFVAGVIRRAYGQPKPPVSGRTSEAHRDLAERTRAEIARTISDHPTLAQLASRVGASPFHLCRVFREQAGTTLHAFRTQLRMRIALERLPDARGDLSRLALELGYSSHSHFSAAVKREWRASPHRLQKLLR